MTVLVCIAEETTFADPPTFVAVGGPFSAGGNGGVPYTLPPINAAVKAESTIPIMANKYNLQLLMVLLPKIGSKPRIRLQGFSTLDACLSTASIAILNSIPHPK